MPLKECHTFTREGCKLCPDFAAEHADISTGGIGAFNDWTLTLVRTDVGREIMEGLERDGWIEVRGADEDLGAIELLHKLAKKQRSRWPEFAHVDRASIGRRVGRDALTMTGRRTHIRIPVAGRYITPLGQEFASVEALSGIVLLLATVAGARMGELSVVGLVHVVLGSRRHGHAGAVLDRRQPRPLGERRADDDLLLRRRARDQA